MVITPQIKSMCYKCLFHSHGGRKDYQMKKKTLIALLLVLATILFSYVLTIFVVGQLSAPIEPKLLVDVHKFFMDQYDFITKNFEFLMVLLVLLLVIIGITVTNLVPKKIGSKKDTRYGVEYTKKNNRNKRK